MANARTGFRGCRGAARVNRQWMSCRGVVLDPSPGRWDGEIREFSFTSCKKGDGCSSEPWGEQAPALRNPREEQREDSLLK